jgi:di/tricarboxylate transporter
MAITLAAYLSLVAPWGHQTNTLIYGPGHYRFTDFTRVGAPLNIVFWILGTILIPVFWP